MKKDTEISKKFLKELKDFSFLLTQKASSIALKKFNKNIKTQIKSDRSPVTEVDQAVETFFREQIEKRYPDHQICGEEFGKSGNPKSPFCWWIDPIDGTLAFIRGLPTWGSVLGCEYKNEVIAGAFSLPVSKKVFAAAKGLGCHLNQKKKMKAHRKCPLKEASIYYGRLEHTTKKNIDRLLELTKQTRDQRGWGDVYAYSLLLEGKADAMIDFIVQAYDISAISICISEAGAQFSSLSGENSIHQNTALASCNRELHRKLVQKFLN